MCNKQCRDENGFKCHLTSESHKRQMEVFGQNPHRVISGFSEEFEKTFLEHLKRAHPFSRVSANVVYNEYIQDRHHIHMNATKWLTLTEFIKYLGRTGKCKVEETPKGWYIMLIQKDPFEELDEKKRHKRVRAEKEEEDRHQRDLEVQIERARQLNAEANHSTVNGQTESPTHEDAKAQGQPVLGFQLPSKLKATEATAEKSTSKRFLENFQDDEEDEDQKQGGFQSRGDGSKKKSKVEQLIEADMVAKAAKQRKDVMSGRKDKPWLAKGIIVKVMSQALLEHGYYKEKGLVLAVLDDYVAEIEMLKSGDIIRVDQEELETVIPQPGGEILVLAGEHRGKHGVLLEIDTKAYAAYIRLKDGTQGRNELMLEYEEFSKLGG
jgi:DNA/RNA-binding protein KIN17